MGSEMCIRDRWMVGQERGELEQMRKFWEEGELEERGNSEERLCSVAPVREDRSFVGGPLENLRLTEEGISDLILCFSGSRAAHRVVDQIIGIPTYRSTEQRYCTAELSTLLSFHFSTAMRALYPCNRAPSRAMNPTIRHRASEPYIRCRRCIP